MDDFDVEWLRGELNNVKILTLSLACRAPTHPGSPSNYQEGSSVCKPVTGNDPTDFVFIAKTPFRRDRAAYSMGLRVGFSSLSHFNASEFIMLTEEQSPILSLVSQFL